MPSSGSMHAAKRWSRVAALEPPAELPYRAIVERQSELISVARSDGTLVFVNPACAEHFGFMPAAMVGTNLFDFVEPADRHAVAEQIADVVLTGQSRCADIRVPGADGGVRWFEWTNHLQRSAQGPLVLSVGRDVTQRKLAALMQQASEALARRIARLSGVGGWQVELASGAVIWTEETRRLHGVAADYVPTLARVIDFYAAAARPVVRAALASVIAGGPGRDLALPFVTADGRRLRVRLQCEVECEQGVPVRLVGTFQAIGENDSRANILRPMRTAHGGPPPHRQGSG